MAALAVAILLAGCSAPKAAEPDASQPVAPAGSLLGVVVDEAVRPLAGAVITIPALPALAPATTGEDGLFRFDGLAPGAVFVQVEKPGYLAATAQGRVSDDAGAPVLNVVLRPLAETTPYIVQETWEGIVDCGLGSQVAFGLTFSCTQTVAAGVNNMCHGFPPIPPTGVCIDETQPYFFPQAAGNMSMAQSELMWDATVQGQSELLMVHQLFDSSGVVLGGTGSATGPSFLVLRLNSTLLRDNDIGGANHLGIYVSAGNGPAVNVAFQQPFKGFHTTAYHFEFEPEWVFVRDGAPVIPPVCTTCLGNAADASQP